MVSAGHVGDTRGSVFNIQYSGIVSCAPDVLWMSVVPGMREVGVVYEICMCLARGGIGAERGEWMRGLGLGFYQSCGNMGSDGRVSMFRLWRCRWGMGRGLGPGSGGVEQCYGLSV